MILTTLAISSLSSTITYSSAHITISIRNTHRPPAIAGRSNDMIYIASNDDTHTYRIATCFILIALGRLPGDRSLFYTSFWTFCFLYDMIGAQFYSCIAWWGRRNERHYDRALCKGALGDRQYTKDVHIFPRTIQILLIDTSKPEICRVLFLIEPL